MKKSEQLTLVRWGSWADLSKKGGCWYAVVNSLRTLNIVDEILKTYFLRFCATLYSKWNDVPELEVKLM